MNITYLIGNGFDLYLGMNTSPKAFLKDFVEKSASTSDADVADLIKHIKTEGIDTWADFEMQLGNHSHHFNNSSQDIDRYLKQVEALETSLAEWLKKEDEKISDELLAEKAKLVFPSFANVVFTLNTDGVRIQENTGPEDYLNFLCFNYTSAFQRAWRMDADVSSDGLLPSRQSTLVLPHGSLDTLLVCGVDGIDQISNISLRENEDVSACLVKENMQRNDNFSFDVNGMEIIQESDIVCVFGMSLGHSDRRWWKHIADMLYSPRSPLNQLVIFSYEMNGTNLAISPVRYKAKKSVRDKFFAAAEIEDYQADTIRTSIQAYPANLILPDCK